MVSLFSFFGALPKGCLRWQEGEGQLLHLAKLYQTTIPKGFRGIASSPKQ